MANVKALIKFRDILTEVINVLIRLDNYHFPTPSIVALKKYLTDIETYCQPADTIADIVQNDNYLQNKKLYLLPLEGLFKCDFGIGVISCNNVVYDFWDGLNERLEKEGFKECDIVEYTNLVQRIIHSIEDCLSGIKSDFSYIGIIEEPTNDNLSLAILPNKLDKNDAKYLFCKAIEAKLMKIDGDKYIIGGFAVHVELTINNLQIVNELGYAAQFNSSYIKPTGDVKKWYLDASKTGNTLCLTTDDDYSNLRETPGGKILFKVYKNNLNNDSSMDSGKDYLIEMPSKSSDSKWLPVVFLKAGESTWETGVFGYIHASQVEYCEYILKY